MSRNEHLNGRFELIDYLDARKLPDGSVILGTASHCVCQRRGGEWYDTSGVGSSMPPSALCGWFHVLYRAPAPTPKVGDKLTVEQVNELPVRAVVVGEAGGYLNVIVRRNDGWAWVDSQWMMSEHLEIHVDAEWRLVHLG